MCDALCVCVCVCLYLTGFVQHMLASLLLHPLVLYRVSGLKATALREIKLECFSSAAALNMTWNEIKFNSRTRKLTRAHTHTRARTHKHEWEQVQQEIFLWMKYKCTTSY